MSLGRLLPLVLVLLCSIGVAAPPVVPIPSSGIGPLPTGPTPQDVKRIGSRPVLDRPGIIPHMHWIFGMRLDGEGLLPVDESAVVSGKVIDLDHDLPVEDAVVMFYKLGPAPVGMRHDGSRFSMSVTPAGWVMTARDGTFTAKSLEPGEYHIEAYQAETLLVPWLFDSVEPVSIAAGEHRDDVVLKVYEGHSVTGVVREQESGKPIGGARVGVSRPWTVDKDESGQSMGFSYEPVVTDEEGRFTIHGASGREIRLHVDAHERHLQDEQGRRIYAMPLHPTAEARTIELKVDLFPPPQMTGSLVDADGHPISEGEVAWQPGNVSDYGRTTDRTWVPLLDDGRFELTITQRSYGHLFIRAKDYPLAAYGSFRLDESVPEPLQILLPNHGSIDLHVRDHLGVGVADADVLIRRSSAGSGPGPVLIYVREDAPHSHEIRVKTEPTGYVRVEGLIPGEYTVEVPTSARPELAPTLPVGISVQPDELLMETVTVAPYQQMAGRVVDEQDQPIAGSQVTLFRLTPQTEPQVATTDADGRFQFERVAPPEKRMVRVSGDGYQTMNFNREQLTGDELTIVLRSTDVNRLTVRLAVRDDDTGELIPNASVTSYRSPSEVAVTEVSPGQFILSNARLTPFRFAKVEAPGYAPLLLGTPYPPVSPTEVPESIDLEARLKRGLSVSGRLLDVVTGAPMQDVTVVAIVGASRQVSYWDVGSGNYGIHAEPQTTTIDEEGRFHFETLAMPPERRPMDPTPQHGLLFVFQSHHPLWMEHDITFKPQGTGHHDLGDIAIYRNAPMTVTVTRDGQPVLDALVLVDEGYVYPNRETNSTQRLRQLTKADGATTFPWVRSRHVRVRVPSLMLERRVTLEDPAADRVVNIEAGSAGLEMTTTRHGVVHGADITMTSTDGYRVISENRDSPDLRPDSRGLVRIHSLPEGTWDLSVSRVGGSGNSRYFRMDLDEGEMRYLHVEIEHGTIAARVEDAEGQPVEGARFAILGREWQSVQPMDHLYDRESTADGRAELRELPAGNYGVLSWRRDEGGGVEYFRADDVRVEAGVSTEVILRPDPRRRTLRVRMLDKETGLPIPNAFVATSIPHYSFNSRTARTGPNGEVAVLDGLPAAPLSVRCWAETHLSTWTTVDLTGKADAVELEITLVPGGRLTWRIEVNREEQAMVTVVVRDADGRNLPNQYPRNYMASPGRALDVSTTLPEGDYLAVADVRGGSWIETPIRIKGGKVTPLMMALDHASFRILEHHDVNGVE